MAARHVAQKLSLHTIIVLLGAALWLGVFSIAPIGQSSAKAENYRSGVVFRKGVKRKNSATASPLRNSAFQSHSRKYKKHHGKHYRKKIRKHRRDRLVERRREIEARNRRVAFENAQRRNQNVRLHSGAGVIVLDSTQVGVLSSDFDERSTTLVAAPLTPCPRSHNCGYRLYSDGTGPRIIRPGTSGGGNLPTFDGLSGPQIITLD